MTKKMFLMLLNLVFAFVYAEEVDTSTSSDAVVDASPPVLKHNVSNIEESAEGLLNKVRTEERTKAFKDIQARDTRIKNLLEDNNSLRISILNLEESLKNALGEGANLETLKREHSEMKEALKQVKDAPDRAAIEAEIRAAIEAEQALKKELSDYKETLLKSVTKQTTDGKEVCATIVDMIRGNSKEEIDQSFAIATKLYQDVAATIVDTGTVSYNNKPFNPYANIPPATPPTLEKTGGPDINTLADKLGTMSDAEFFAKAGEILASMPYEVRSAANMM